MEEERQRLVKGREAEQGIGMWERRMEMVWERRNGRKRDKMCGSVWEERRCVKV